MRPAFAEAIRQCPRPCFEDRDPETGAISHHWMEEARGIACKHCRAGINWTVKCASCGHELIDHWCGDDEEGSLPCALLVGQEGSPEECPCEAMRISHSRTP